MEIIFFAFLLTAAIFIIAAGSYAAISDDKMAMWLRCFFLAALTVILGVPLTFAVIVESGVFVAALFIAVIYGIELAIWQRNLRFRQSAKTIIWWSYVTHLLCAACVFLLGWQAGWLETYPLEWTEENGNWLQNLPYSSWYWLYAAIAVRSGLHIYYLRIR